MKSTEPRMYDCTLRSDSVVLHKTGEFRATRQALFAQMQQLGVTGACSFTAFHQVA